MSVSSDHQRVGEICRRIAVGRRLARQLAAAVRQHQLSEAEFRLLWLLESQSAVASEARLEQSVLADRLGISPAQVSAIVEKLRCQQVLVRSSDRSDRRRRVWQLTADGRKLFESTVLAVGSLCQGWEFVDAIPFAPRVQQENAA